MDKKTMGWLFVGFILIYSIFSTTQYHKIADMMLSMKWYNAIFLYMALNLAFLAIIIGAIYFYQKKGMGAIKGLISGTLLVFAFDVTSMPKCAWANNLIEGCGQNIMSVTNSDFYFLKAMTDIGIGYKTSFVFYYIILPALLIIIIAQISGWIEINRRIKSMLK